MKSAIQDAQPVWIQRQLIHLLGQRGHAWLLQGPSGLGQFDLAMELVRAWLCESTANAQSTPRGDTERLAACGHCASCHTIDVHTHADLAILMPETEMLARGWPLPERAQAEIDNKKRKPSREIRVESLRSVIEFTQRTSARGRGKTVLVYPAERMNAISANALLKTLEEPLGDVRFVLASDAAHLLLPTLRSRCQIHVMTWPSQSEALAWLQQQNMPADDALIWLRAAGGRPAQAMALAQRNGGGQYWAQLARRLRTGDAAALADTPLSESVLILQKLCHDLMLVQTGAMPRYFLVQDLPQRPPSMAALARWWKQLTQVARTAEHNFNVGLAHECLASMARQALNSNL